MISMSKHRAARAFGILFFVGLLLGMQGFTEGFQVKWGQKFKPAPESAGVIYVDADGTVQGNAFVLRASLKSSPSMRASTHLVLYDNVEVLVINEAGDIIHVARQELAEGRDHLHDMELKIMDDRVYLIYSTINHKEKVALHHALPIDPETGKAIQKPIQLVRIAFDKPRDASDLFVPEIGVKNRMVAYWYEKQSEESSNLQIRVYDAQLKVLRELSYADVSSEEAPRWIRNEVALSDQNQLLIPAFTLASRIGKTTEIGHDYSVLHFEAEKDSPKSYPLKLEGFRIQSVIPRFGPAGEITAYGFYCEREGLEAIGVYTIKFSSGAATGSVKLNPFPKEMVDTYASDDHLKGSPGNRGKKPKGFHGLVPRYFAEIGGGRAILVAEQHFTRDMTQGNYNHVYSTQAPGELRKNIIAAEIDFSGEVAWVRCVPKNQFVPANQILNFDGFAAALHEHRLELIFNSGRKELDELSGLFASATGLEEAEKECIAHVSIGSKGSMTLGVLPAADESKELLVPNISSQLNNKGMLLMTRRFSKSARFGRINF